MDHPVPIPELSPRVKFLLEADHRLLSLWEGIDKNGGDTSRSGYDFTFALELLRRRVTPDEVVVALLHRPNSHRGDVDYAELTVTRALEKLEERR